MKLGEALSTRAKQAQKLDDLRGRIRANALTQEGTDPVEDPQKLLEDFGKVSEEHSRLLLQIANTNAVTIVEQLDMTLLAALHKREHLRRTRNMFDAAATAATPRRDSYHRYSQSELRDVPQVPVAAFRKLVEEMDEQVRQLDAVIQEVNWKTDLL